MPLPFRRLLALFLAVATLPVLARADAATQADDAYLFSYFIDNGQDGLHLAWSDDGLRWEALKQGKSFLTPRVGRSKLMRDPCIARGPDGVFHLVWTDSWDSKTIGYASSRDLITWSEQKAIPVMVHEPSAKNCWAPEIIYDAKREHFLIYWATTLPAKFTETWFGGKNDNNHRIYRTTTKDFATFTPAELFFEPGFNAIDSTIIPFDGKFHMVVKDESKFPQARKNLLHAVADNLDGPYLVQSAPVTPPGTEWVEGPSLLRIGDYTYVYYDVYGRHRYEAKRTRDWRTWETIPAGRLVMPRGIRHGTAFTVPRSILDNLRGASLQPAASTISSGSTYSSPSPASTSSSASFPAQALPGHAPRSGNPILPGYFADPAIVSHGASHYLYATLDPWGGDTLGCWESTDFANWTYRVLNWPTKAACTSPTSKGAKVWAPSVVRARDGRFYMYVSVGSEVWAGVADHPAGPWRNALGDRPLIPENYKPGFHMIDAEAFLDDDGHAYLYWGSGHNWTNGRCWAVRLRPDMVTFDGEVRDVTPANYFEGPFMVKHGDRYYLTYSQGKTTEESYRVHYAVGNNPFGPFSEAGNSPLLVTDRAAGVIAPGHHAIFKHEGANYILYHRHSVPFDPKFIGRQTCLDELRFTPEGLIAKLAPTHSGPAFLQGLRTRRDGLVNLATPAVGATATASSQREMVTSAGRVLDDNYATRWAAARDAAGAWLRLDLGAERDITRQELRFEYPWKSYRYNLETSLDGQAWTPLITAPADAAPAGSPVVIISPARARHLRLVFPDSIKGDDISLFEWGVY